MSVESPIRAGAQPRSLAGLRANSLAALAMLLVEYGLGVTVMLYAGVPQADRGKAVLPAFLSAVTHGPIALTLHALLGTLLIVTSFFALLRAAGSGHRGLTVIAVAALLAILLAWGSGSRFVGSAQTGALLSMAIATGVAIFCYALMLFITPVQGSA